ncbi:hypothetical protein NM688_g8975 [Phlebia brevispora]|uniref:Uncharacterized protein n=1 Tax=Phlebia brevispora TaxID=194682 RepID=A0ACC1RKV3_9APHY|nr:hypothetical protein NM688_g8975 [Phlebia brevispora]
MSRQPSPAPPTLHNNQMYHQQPATSSSSKQRTKPFATNIPGGADDVKYQAKYKELKKKVKEIELDNDRLYLKLLLAKKNIRRMNLERAILYERLAAVPPTPGRHTQELPPEHDPMYAQPPSGPTDPSHSVDPRDQALQDYLRNNPNARVVRGPDDRIVAIEDPTANGSREHSGASGPPPHGLPIVQHYHDPNLTRILLRHVLLNSQIIILVYIPVVLLEERIEIRPK